jgi:integrase
MPKCKVADAIVLAAEKETLRLLTTSNLTPERLLLAGDDDLLALQAELFLGSEWGIINIPPNLLADHRIPRSKHTYELGRALPEGIAVRTENATEVWRELLRFAIARRCFPLRARGGGGRPWYSSILVEVRTIAVATRLIVQRPGPGFWSRITAEEFVNNTSKGGVTYLGTLKKLAQLGAIRDAPKERKRVVGNGPARHRTGEAEDVLRTHIDVQYQPLPDAFTSAAGARALYFTEHVGPALLDLLEACQKTPIRWISKRADSNGNERALGEGNRQRLRSATLNSVVESWDWRNAAGGPLTTLKYDAVFRGPACAPFSWPPRSFAQAEAALTLLQSSHLFLISLSDGGRHGEILSVEEGAAQRIDSGSPTLVSATRKTDPNGGRMRETPLPSSVAAALAQQERLSRYIKDAYGVSGRHVWVQIGHHRGLALSSFTKALNGFVTGFKLNELLSGTRLHMHRFRKTLARVCALALVHAPKILMDIFGHKDEQMTILRYILSDPGLLSEIEEVSKELLVLKGVWLVENIGRIEGKGAERLRKQWGRHVEVIGKSALEPQNIEDFVRAMFENGSSFAVVAPGILCTGFTRGGMCNAHGEGEPNPEHCDPRCENQVSCPSFDSYDSFVAQDAVTNALNTADYLLRQLHSASCGGEPMLAATFEAQVRSLTGRWREVDLFVKSHPLGRRFIAAKLLS